MIDLSQAPIAIALISLSGALLKQSLNGKKSNNGCYVKRDDCHNAMDNQTNSFNTRIEDLKDHIDTRLNDVITLLKNGK